MRRQQELGCHRACSAMFQNSSICKAAVHAGVIGDSSGGYVDVMPVDKKKVYNGSLRNGIRSESLKTPREGKAFRIFATVRLFGERDCSLVGFSWGERRLPHLGQRRSLLNPSSFGEKNKMAAGIGIFCILTASAHCFIFGLLPFYF
ncbi:hypothetical protein E2320_001265 [Naja naja]|nr:hypothetical protein E2320_001265 [Naja naja]